MQGAGVAGAGGQTAGQKLDAAHQALLKTKGIQFDFAAQKIEPPPDWFTELLRSLAVLAPLLQVVFWGGLILGLLLIAWFVIREFAPETAFFRRRAKTPATDWRPEPQMARALLDDADRLAGEGRYGEAIHLLLFRSIDELAGRRPGAVKPALTSRDIARLETLPAGAREAFARLALAVETSFFGGRPAGADAFGRARADYEAFAFAEGWR